MLAPFNFERIYIMWACAARPYKKSIPYFSMLALLAKKNSPSNEGESFILRR